LDGFSPAQDSANSTVLPAAVLPPFPRLPLPFLGPACCRRHALPAVYLPATVPAFTCLHLYRFLLHRFAADRISAISGLRFLRTMGSFGFLPFSTVPGCLPFSLKFSAVLVSTVPFCRLFLGSAFACHIYRGTIYWVLDYRRCVFTPACGFLVSAGFSFSAWFLHRRI